MDLTITAVFIQGLLSFLSPCVLPILPLYIGYLSGGTKELAPNGEMVYNRKKIMLNTVCFVVGISFTFFLLGLGFTAVGQFFGSNRMLISRIGGVLVIIFGMYQLGLFGFSKMLGSEKRLPFKLDKVVMNPLVALVLGFTFSFAWTPCIGPVLGSVMIMAGTAATKGNGFFLIAIYTLGFILPFLAVGLFTTSLLNLFKKHRNVLKYTVKVGGAILIIMGIMMITGWMNGITGYLSRVTAPNAGDTVSSEQAEEPKKNSIEAPDFTYTDQEGNTHTLSDYVGKTVLLHFWGTWCHYCVQELPALQEKYEEYGENGEDLVILSLVQPNIGGEGDIEFVKNFVKEKNVTFPVLFDETGESFKNYGISGFPTAFMIKDDGSVYGSISGGLSTDHLEQIISQTMTAE